MLVRNEVNGKQLLSTKRQEENSLSGDEKGSYIQLGWLRMVNSQEQMM
jgi:hypothetical protein